MCLARIKVIYPLLDVTTEAKRLLQALISEQLIKKAISSITRSFIAVDKKAKMSQPS